MWRLQTVGRLAALSHRVVSEQMLKSQGCSANVVRNYWNKDWAASPQRPTTKKEHEEAAKKYGLLPEDYQPYPDDDISSMGDYPKLPDKGVDSRDPWEDYDFPSLRRNFGDPIHLHADIYGEDRYQPDAKYYISIPKMYLILSVITVTIFGLMWVGESYKRPMLVMEKQLPYKHLYEGGEPPVHYTFNTLSEDDLD